MSDKDYEYSIQWYNERQNSAIIDVSDMGLSTLTELIEANFINLDPDYQRRKRWKIKRQSQLIDSFMRNIPIPPVYLAEDQTNRGTYAVIDGKQRLTTISDYFSNRFRLSEDIEGPFAGKYFRELPTTVQVSLRLKTLRTTTILYGSDIKIVHEVFIRLNTGGEPLSRQEIRNVAYHGKLNNMLIRLSENEFLRNMFGYTNDSASYKKMADIEMVLRFFTLTDLYFEAHSTDGGHQFPLPNGLAGAMDNYMEANRNPSDSKINELEQRFNTTICTVEQIWGDRAFKTESRDQTRAPLFDAEMIAVAFNVRDNTDLQRILVSHRNEILDKTNEILKKDTEFIDSITRATNTPSKVAYRIQTLSNMIGEFL